MKNILKQLGITFVISFIYYYFSLPALNPTNKSFWYFLAFILLVFLFSKNGKATIKKISQPSENQSPLSETIRNLKIKDIKKENLRNIILMSSIVVIFLIIIITNTIGSPVFMAKAYSQRITIDETSEFTKDVRPLDSSTLPIIDKASSIRLGDRVMGQIPDLVSQFTVSNLYTQINSKNQIIRVTPLEYNNFFKLLANRKNGVMGYITVNSVTGETELIRLKEGMKYLDSAILNKDLNRKLRFSYPTKNFGDKEFEIDDEGRPFWTIPTLSYKGIGIRAKVTGLIIFDPITGKSQLYDIEDIPTWVDHAFPEKLIIEQIDHWGIYTKGFFNSILSQQNVKKTTRGYNYTIFNDDVYLYTGITSTVEDESILGFIMTNLRTGKTNYYTAPGAEEYSAMASAAGQVQQMNYTPTFPLLINLNNKPTYFVSLKDRAGLVKMYAFVDVADYQKVVVTDAGEGIKKAISNYIGDSVFVDKNEIFTKTITIKFINSAIIDNSTVYYILDSEDNKYKIGLKSNEALLPFLKINQKLDIKYLTEGDLIELLDIE